MYVSLRKLLAKISNYVRKNVQQKCHFLPSEQPPTNNSVFETRKKTSKQKVEGERERDRKDRKPKWNTFCSYSNFVSENISATELNPKSIHIYSQEKASQTGMEEIFSHLKVHLLFEVLRSR